MPIRMPTIVTATIPAAEFVLAHALDEHPELTFEVERIVSTGDHTVMPMLWVRGAERPEIEETLERDDSVDNVSILGDFSEEWLFQMEWVYRADLITDMITRSEATILDAVGHRDEWKLRVLYPQRSQFSKTHDFCKKHGLNFDVDAIRELDEEPAGRYGLTPDQYEVLAAAAQHGYFEVPREVTLAELADELDVSHQALSERLRRAMAALVDDTLFVELTRATK